jgi:sugar-phosphatase
LPGAQRAIDLTSQRGPIALASSTPLALIEKVLEHFGLRDHFVSLHSAQFEPFGKPHPGVFLSAAASLGVAPDRCLVFEDSAAGVIAAKAARMTVLAVPTATDRVLPAFALADEVLASLEDLEEKWLDDLFAPAWD